MPVLNLHNFSAFYLVCAVEEGGFNFETTGKLILEYVELRCERAYSELYMDVSLVDITKFAYESLEFSRPLYVISNGVKN